MSLVTHFSSNGWTIPLILQFSSFFKTFMDPCYQFHGIYSMWGINSIVDLILEDIVPCEEIEDFRIVVIISCVWGKDTPIGQHISNMQTIWQLSAGDEKSVPALKINIFMWHGRPDSILDSYSIPGNRFLPRNTSKNTGSDVGFPCSVSDPDPGPGAILTPGSGIRDR